jgi:hypothetical protein
MEYNSRSHVKQRGSIPELRRDAADTRGEIKRSSHVCPMGAVFERYLGVAEMTVVVNAPLRGLLGTVSSNLPQLK